jgi:hypothetical protein
MMWMRMWMLENWVVFHVCWRVKERGWGEFKSEVAGVVCGVFRIGRYCYYLVERIRSVVVGVGWRVVVEGGVKSDRSVTSGDESSKCISFLLFGTGGAIKLLSNRLILSKCFFTLL